MPISWDKDGYVKFALDFEIDRFAAEGIGVLDGCVVSANGTDANVSWTAGCVHHSNAEVLISASSLDLSTYQHATYPRKILIFVDATDGVVKAVAGDGQAVVPSTKTGRYTRKPIPPDFGGSFALAAGDVVLAEVWLRTTGLCILATDVTDRRSGIGNQHLIDSGQPNVATLTMRMANGQAADGIQLLDHSGNMVFNVTNGGAATITYPSNTKIMNALGMPGTPYTAAQIHAAIAALPLVLDIDKYHPVGAVYIPEGTWIMDGTPLGDGYDYGGLTHVKLMGAGKDQTFLSWEGETTASNGIDVGFSTDLDTHVVIKDMTLLGDDDKAGKAIAVEGICRGLSIDNVHISHWGGNGIFINGYYSPSVTSSNSISIRDTDIDHTEVGVMMQGGGGDVRLALLERAHCWNSDMGIYGAGFRFLTVLNSKLTECTSEISTSEGFSFSGCRNIGLDTCYAEGVGIGYRFAGNGSQIEMSNSFGYGNGISLHIADTYKSDFYANQFLVSGTCKMTAMVPGCRAWNNTDPDNTWDFTGLTSPSGEPAFVEELNPPGAGAPGKIVRGGSVVGQLASAASSPPTLVTDGQACVWRDTTNSKTYLVTRIGGVDYKVELT